MQDRRISNAGGYLLAAAFGALAGGATVLIATRAIPKIMSEMMGNMVASMEARGCSPADI